MRAAVWLARARIVLALLLAGPALARAEPTHVTLWHAYRGDEERALLEVVSAYETTSPDVAVEVLSIPFDAYGAKLSASVPRAHGPDVFIEAHERLGSYLREGIVAPAGDALPAADAADYDAVALRAVSSDGVAYAVPLSSKCLALFVNDALVPKTPATLEEIVALRAALPAGVYPLAYDTTSAFLHAPFLHAFGGAMLDAEDHFAFHGPAAARSLAFSRSLVALGAVPEEPSGALVTQLFASGHAAAVINGPWLVGDLRGAVKYRVEPLPRILAAGPGGAPMRPFLTVEGAFLTPRGAERPEARALARYLGGVASAVIRARVGHQVVTRASAWRALDEGGEGKDPLLGHRPGLP